MSKIVEIRWHGRGGQGAKTACLLLADAAFSSGKYVQGFPEYGPERMGAPITPAIVLADEPTGNLDSRTSADVLGLLKMTSEEFHQTVVMITHNNEIAQLSHRIVRIEDGRIVGKAEV